VNPNNESANSSDNQPSEPSQRRLQRSPDFTGPLLSKFSDVVLRHGLPGLLLALICLAHPASRELLVASTTTAIENWDLYLPVALLTLIALCSYALSQDRKQDRKLDAMKLTWIVYLLGISIWEEWVFRLAIPQILVEQELTFRASVVISNLLFGAMHYFTLRWKWQWCVLAFLGGMGLSRNFHAFEDFMLIVAIHWIATFINTPRYPGQLRAG